MWVETESGTFRYVLTIGSNRHSVAFEWCTLTLGHVTIMVRYTHTNVYVSRQTTGVISTEGVVSWILLQHSEYLGYLNSCGPLSLILGLFFDDYAGFVCVAEIVSSHIRCMCAR